ncbi:hypothetical protein A946_03185 [Methylacidiphilum kamchatkense Kam1]|uniref:Uncharacterized protein n=1 Tax=Methylacidiphilum kamchatkense Kam1 TaxID=1202785 RepID=A0A0C1V5N4_9BACT|nr:hypothetical protein [Methylacidiphilum kamchatkense]KIE59050.1 hypothetical protein A946_03185 [Methylacidiphilum kamchatkense Kam1]QDQ43048.1 hypothetical protein kam1_1834 [Methylacidiphilum kamchatkense Kam1]
MNNFHKQLSFWLLLFWILFRPAFLFSSPFQEVASFSSIPNISEASLSEGTILGNFDDKNSKGHVILIETCFIVPADPQAVSNAFLHWDPSKFPSLKVFSHLEHATADAFPFNALPFDIKKTPIKKLLQEAFRVKPGRSSLNLSTEEIKQLQADLSNFKGKIDEHSAQALHTFFVNDLQSRLLNYSKSGLLNLPPYENGNSPVKPIEEIDKMTKASPKIYARYQALLDSLLSNWTSQQPPQNYYCNFFDANGMGTLTLGSSYGFKTQESWQQINLEFYVSAIYYNGMEIVEMWPLESKGKMKTLVWKAHMLAVPIGGLLEDVNRMAYGLALLQGTKNADQAFLSEFSSK